LLLENRQGLLCLYHIYLVLASERESIPALKELFKEVQFPLPGGSRSYTEEDDIERR